MRARRSSIRLACELMERRELLSTFVVSNTSDNANPAPNSLRWAISQVNNDSTPDTIDFAIPGGGAQSIQLKAALPAITNAVTIDGTTQGTNNGAPLIELNGSSLGAGSNGLVISGGPSTILGLSIVGFSGAGIVLNSPGGDVVSANDLGVTPGGAALANGVGISILGSSNNTVGGAAASSGNLISGNTGDGIVINGGNGAASANCVEGNRIGVTAGGLSALANGGAGVEIDGATATQVGFAAGGFGNVISGNLGPGLEITAGAAGTLVQNNLIGVGVDGATAVGNVGDGILINGALATTVGGSDLAQGNVIGANHANGIETANGAIVRVEGNEIGTDATGTLNLGNRLSGILLGSSGNSIGGTASGNANTIVNNGIGQVGSGVQLNGSFDDNSILSNSIYGNAGLGINFGDGPTPNHAPGTPGPNDYQNHPTLALAQSDGSTTEVQGSLYSTPNSSFLIQFFASPVPSWTGYGQGKTLVGASDVTTDQNGDASFTESIPVGLAPGQYLSATATDPNGNTSEFAADVPLKGLANLILTGTASPNPVPAGGQVTYVVTVSNSGNLAASNVTLSDQLPGSVSLVSASASQGTMMPNMGGGTVTAILGTISPGGSATLTIAVDTASTSLGTITDTATVSSNGNNPPALPINTTVLSSADVSINLSASPSPVFVGGQLTDTVTVTNSGPQTATDVVVTLPLAPGLTYVPTSGGSPTVTDSNGVLTVSLGDLDASAVTTFTVVVEPTVAGSLTQSATVSTTSLEPSTANNVSTVTTQVAPASDLAVTLVGSAAAADTVDDFTYTVTVTDNGPSDATGVVLTDTLPAGLTILSASSTVSATPVESGSAQTGIVISLPVGALANGASATMTIVAAPPAAPGVELVDTASASGDQADPVPANNDAELDTPVQGIADLGISSAVPAGPIYVGQNLIFTLTLTNEGPNDEPDAVVTCPVPPALQFVPPAGSSAAVPAINNGVLTDDVGLLAAGSTTTVTLVFIPQASAAGSLNVPFTIQGQDEDNNQTNNTTYQPFTVTPAADLAIALTTPTAAPAVQVGWTYQYTVSNLGLSDATDVTVSSMLPANAQISSISCSQGSDQVGANGSLTALLGTMDAGQTATISIVAIPKSPGFLPVSASVSGDQFDPDLSNNQTSSSASVNPSVALKVALVPTEESIVAGTTLKFVATVTNTGPNAATNVVLNLPLGPGISFDWATPSTGAVEMVGNQVVTQLGSINPGASDQVTVAVTPANPGLITQTASVASPENELSTGSLTASTTATVLQSPGTFQFQSDLFSAPETASAANIVVTRSGGALGTVTVNYQATAANATPGVDFTPTAGTLTFGPGQTIATFQVPVIVDPWDNHDEFVNLQLSSPGNGANIGSLSTAQLDIVDVDPDNTPPQVSQFTWAGSASSITSLNVVFNAPLNPTYATMAANYELTNPAAGGASISFASISYNPSTYTVTLVPSSGAISSGTFYEFEVVGTGGSAVRDLAGNLLDGASNGVPATNYVAFFGQGKKLKYVDNSGNKVSLKMSGPGYIEDVLNSQHIGQVLTLAGTVRKRSTLSGTLKSRKHGSGSTNLGIIQGVGAFGSVRISLKSPPFLVKQYPFQQRSRGKT